MNKGPFGIHQIKFSVESIPSLRNCSCVRKHANCSRHSSLISIGYNGRSLVVYSNFETSWTPIDKLKIFNLFLILLANFELILRSRLQTKTWIERLVLMLAIAALTSLGTTSPRYNRQQAIYFPDLGSHFTIWLFGSKQAVVISWTVCVSWLARSFETIGA